MSATSDIGALVKKYTAKLSHDLSFAAPEVHELHIAKRLEQFADEVEDVIAGRHDRPGGDE